MRSALCLGFFTLPLVVVVTSEDSARNSDVCGCTEVSKVSRITTMRDNVRIAWRRNAKKGLVTPFFHLGCHFAKFSPEGPGVVPKETL